MINLIIIFEKGEIFLVRTKKIISSMLIMILIMTMITQVAFAQEPEISGAIDHVLVEIDESNIVRVSLIEYANAYLDGSGHLYEYLLGTNPSLSLCGVVSGQKYIIILDYANMFLDYEGNIEAALENAPSIDPSIVQTFNILIGFDEDGNAILEPVIPEVPGADKTALELKISEAEALNEERYRQDTWAVLVQALEVAHQVYNDVNATQDQVDEAVLALEIAINELVIPTINATFRGVYYPPKFGFVITGVDGLLDAAKFSVEYNLKGKDENGNEIPVLTETTIVNIGQEAGMIYYDPNVAPYNKVNIKIYNGAEELIWRFNNVILGAPNKVSYMSNQFEINLTITN